MKARNKLMKRQAKLMKVQERFKEDGFHGCIHEAGHVLVGYKLGVPIAGMVLKVEISEDGRLMYFTGKTEFEGLNEGMADPEKMDEVRKLCISTRMGGPIAERLFFDWDDERGIGGAQHDFDMLIQILNQIPNVEQKVDIANQQTRLAQRIIEENRDGVKRLAVALADKLDRGQNPGRLEREEIMGILEGDPVFPGLPNEQASPVKERESFEGKDIQDREIVDSGTS